MERSIVAGKLIQSVIELHITDSAANTPADQLEQTKQNWTRIVAEDKDLADMLVEQAAMPKGVIVEINVIGENGKVIVSSVPSRDRPAGARPPEPRLGSRMPASSSQLSAIAKPEPIMKPASRSACMSVPDQPKPVFEIQVLVSSSLLRDKILPDLKKTAVVSLFALLAAVVLAAVSAHLALRPVRRIGKAIDTLSTGRPLGLVAARGRPRGPAKSPPSSTNSVCSASRCRARGAMRIRVRTRDWHSGARCRARNQEPAECDFAAPGNAAHAHFR